VKIDIICIGKLKEDYLRAAQAEYLKRLVPYAQIVVHELPESDLDKEGARISKMLLLMRNAYKIALAIGGKALSSLEFAESINNLGIGGTSHLVFVIGGSDGLADGVLRECNSRLSLSNMTFTHQIARVLLLEQIYRAFKINNNEPYHK